MCLLGVVARRSFFKLMSSSSTSYLSEPATDQPLDIALSRSCLTKIASQLPGVVFQCRLRPDGALSIPFVSETLREICQVSPEQAREDATCVLSLVHPDDAKAFAVSLQRSARDLTPWQHDYRIRLPDGTLRWLAVHAMPERESDGSTLWLGLVIDNTERKRAQQQLLASEARYRRLVENSPDIVYQYSLHRGGLYYSSKVAEVLGYTAEQLCAQPFLWSESIHPLDQARVADALTSFRAGVPYRIEYRIKNSKGNWCWLFDRSIDVREEDGDLIVEGLAMDISEYKVAEEQIKDLAFTDLLTGLANRSLLIIRLQQALMASAQHHQRGALLLIDLDNFKTLNDAFGHDQSDEVLQQVAQRLRHCVRDGDVVARLAGDGFAVLTENLSKSSDETVHKARAIGEKLLLALNQPFRIGEASYPCTGSIGITLFGEQYEDTIEPLRRAEMAMYQSKAAGRNTMRFFEPQMQVMVTDRVALESGLYEALYNNQFSLCYQAQVTNPGRVVGVEALLRWQHPSRGLVMPAAFIGLAEETGLILPLGSWVLETVCQQLVHWASQPQMAHLTVAVNVSPRQFHQPDFVDQVLMVLQRTGARADLLKLEITETVLVSNVEDVITKMLLLKAKGVKFSLDDFGTGYSSLSYLKRLPLDQLKIDQGFVRDILTDANDAAIARMVVALANSLGLTIMAEGVETEAQRDFLAALGCHNYQGYLFSRPLPLAEFEAMMQRA